jgi:hypothetical protein
VVDHDEVPPHPTSRRTAVWSAARADWRTSSPAARTILASSVLVLTYEASSGNESFSTLLATHVMGEVPTLAGVARAGAVVGATVAAQQFACGVLVLAGVRRLPRLFEALGRVVDERFTGAVPTYRSMSLVARIPVSFFMGVSFVVAQDAIARERRPRRSVIASAATSGATLFAVVAVFGGAVVAATGTRAERAARLVFDVVSDWRVWAAAVACQLLVGTAARRWRRWRSRSSAEDVGSPTSDERRFPARAVADPDHREGAEPWRSRRAGPPTTKRGSSSRSSGAS